ncbi:hypothetical protein MycrhDRAFT_1577 [Mycolicibacterium rhodesiae JS60]|nr:hypothetical protein MycrhDRAFT_1577 [Mycolicibacterium rhodesiae JS60]
MSSQKWLWAGLLVATALNMAGAHPAQAEPLTPLTPGELQYLDQARRIFAVVRDPVAFRSDGDLLVSGRYACDMRSRGYLGHGSTLVPPVLTQLAFIYLCPN